MTAMLTRFRFGRFAWTVLVTFYFFVFFRNFFLDAAPYRALPPTIFAWVFVGWLALEYYAGSPFFQSGKAQASAFWRGVFAFYAYPLLGYAVADRYWWHWTQLPFLPVVGWVLGIALFVFGTWMRLDTLFALVRLSGENGPAALRKLVGHRAWRWCRHPRYLATLVQLLGAVLVFNSWGGLVLVVAIGLPLVLVQARYEDRGLRSALKSDFGRYAAEVPMLFPFLRSRR
jgi:protein-S-isoprenylcysteine O-methyltransferase Ste14